MGHSWHKFPRSFNEQRPLSTREAEIARLLALGRTAKEIACDLNLATKTVETHRANLMRKIDAHSIVGLMAWMLYNKRLTVPELAREFELEPAELVLNAS